MINEALISQVKNLSVLDRIALIDQVWQSLGDEEIPVTNKKRYWMIVLLIWMLILISKVHGLS